MDETLDLVMVPSWTQAARLAKIKFAKDNPAWKGSLGTTSAALNALGEETVGISYDPLGDDDVGPLMDTVASVAAFGIRTDGGVIVGCDLQFASISPAAYAWNPATEEPPRRRCRPTSHPSTMSPRRPASTSPRADAAFSGGDVGVWGVLSWNASTRTDAVPQAQYRLVGSGDAGWQPMTLRADNQSAEVGPLADGSTYDFRVRFVAGSTPGPYSAAVTLAASADNTAPGPPTGFVANGGAGQASGAFTSPNSPNFGSAVIYRGTTTTFSAATAIATRYGAPSQSFDFIDSGRSPGTYRYWVRALNRSSFGDASSTVGPLTVTVT